MKTSRIILASTVTIFAVAATVAFVRWFDTPAVKDAYFDPDTDRLRAVPPGIVIVRPTHFSHSIHDGIKHIHDGDSLARTVGRDVPLRNVIAEAYDTNPAHVVLPPDAPQGDFDFLVTTPKQIRKHLQTAVRRNLGYVAHNETRDTPILVLKVSDPTLPGLVVSPGNETEDVYYKNGRLFFKHQPLNAILHGLEAGLVLPVQDQTGLTNCYDFSVVWNQNIQERMQSGDFSLAGVQKVLQGWGLELEPDTASLDMLVVNKAP